jgi:hypothetical protein
MITAGPGTQPPSLRSRLFGISYLEAIGLNPFVRSRALAVALPMALTLSVFALEALMRARILRHTMTHTVLVVVALSFLSAALFFHWRGREHKPLRIFSEGAGAPQSSKPPN